jgi:hypothetical protein
MHPMDDNEWCVLCAILCGMCIAALVVVIGFF